LKNPELFVLLIPLEWKLKDQTEKQAFQVLIGLGSNIQPEKNIPAALELLNSKTQILSVSSIWRSEAVGSSGPDYLNAAVIVSTNLSLRRLRKDLLTKIESELGRIRSENKYMDRTIDLDILVYDTRIIESELWTQAHVAVPSSELMPDFKNPETGESLIEASQRLSAQTHISQLELD
jgi:2-amino-4-hydroxy-6-hydroxymethyldihydropteridine diphosphokinase